MAIVTGRSKPPLRRHYTARDKEWAEQSAGRHVRTAGHNVMFTGWPDVRHAPGRPSQASSHKLDTESARSVQGACTDERH
jgi:hypothetical protein